MPSDSRSSDRPPSATASNEALNGNDSPPASPTTRDATPSAEMLASTMRPPVRWIAPRRATASRNAAPSTSAATTLPKRATPHSAASSRTAPNRPASETWIDSMGVAREPTASHTPRDASTRCEARESASGRGAKAGDDSAPPVDGSASSTLDPESASARASVAPTAPPPATATS